MKNSLKYRNNFFAFENCLEDFFLVILTELNKYKFKVYAQILEYLCENLCYDCNETLWKF